MAKLLEAEITGLLTRIAEPETPEERNAAWDEVEKRLRLLEALRLELNQVCGWGDDTAIHALMHIGNYIRNREADLAVAEQLQESWKDIAEKRSEAIARLRDRVEGTNEYQKGSKLDEEAS